MWSRRQLLEAVGLGVAALRLPGCKNADTTTPDATPDAPVDAGLPWASGGTAAMTDKASYPDPFADGVTSCTLLCATTAGPCTAAPAARQDVSEGYLGLPIRLALKIVDPACAPIAGAVVEIWHTQRTGVYSGVTPNPTLCHGADADAELHGYFRGTQTTDANGRVDFDTCYPGWYSGRAVHIHVRVTLAGTDYAVTQLFFAPGLTKQIFGEHPDYAAYGQPDTSNENDSIFGAAANQAPYLVDTVRMSDGAMLASKVIAIRSSVGDPLCSL